VSIQSLELDRIHCPVLLIHGDADTDAVIKYSYVAHTAQPNSQLIVSSRATHLAFYTHPDFVHIQDQVRTFPT
jgi:pimeloyl-ACP methyl ester carboxylesterase